MKKTLLVLVVFGLLGVGAGVWVSQTGNGSDEGFSYESVQYGTLRDVVNSNGIVKPAQVALVFCKVPGMVEEIYGKVGQRVEKDKTPLFRVNSEMALRTLDMVKARLKKAEGLRDAAKEAVDYVDRLTKLGHAPPTEKELEAKRNYSAAVEGVEEAQGALKQADLALEWTTVKAPISGVIIEKNLYLGQPVGLSASLGGGSGSGGAAGLGQSSPMGPSSGSSTSSFFGITEPKVPFMIAADLEDMEVYAPISQGDIGRVKVGQSASFTVDAFPEVQFKGEVTEINLMPVNVLGATLFPAVIKVRNQKVGQADSPKNSQGGDGDWVLRPGMTVNVDITRDTHKDVWMLPATALSFNLDKRHITPAAEKKLVKLKSLQNPGDWVTVWIMGKDKKPTPIFARISDKKEGKSGINDGNYAEVLDWDLDSEIKPDKQNPSAFPQIIIAAPEPKQSIFDKTPFKIS